MIPRIFRRFFKRSAKPRWETHPNEYIGGVWPPMRLDDIEAEPGAIYITGDPRKPFRSLPQDPGEKF